MFNTLFYPTTMNRKEYLIAQGNVQKDVSALAETLKTQLAVFPEAIKVGEELKVIGFKGETLNDLYLICTRGEDEEVYELKYTILTRKSQDGLTTPSERYRRSTRTNCNSFTPLQRICLFLHSLNCYWIRP